MASMLYTYTDTTPLISPRRQKANGAEGNCLRCKNASSQEFLESLDPLSDFGGNTDALEKYLYDQSLMLEPKHSEKAAIFVSFRCFKTLSQRTVVH